MEHLLQLLQQQQQQQQQLQQQQVEVQRQLHFLYEELQKKQPPQEQPPQEQPLQEQPMQEQQQQQQQQQEQPQQEQPQEQPQQQQICKYFTLLRINIKNYFILIMYLFIFRQKKNRGRSLKGPLASAEGDTTSPTWRPWRPRATGEGPRKKT
ncbi:ataxin-8-like [Monomorium pharaonis]|uniref:ataxin-8-like n=1 Tax=Monomorium pharaonis TaxID=307658 RepID=UPI0017474C9F|nr:ataxin-8-like [Monomorium pharaonis]